VVDRAKDYPAASAPSEDMRTSSREAGLNRRAGNTIHAVATAVGVSILGSQELENGGPEPQTSRTLCKNLRIAWFIGLVVFGIQLILLIEHSWYLWDHFDLTADFGQYSQAWQQIATGHLNPYDTTYPWNYPHYGYSFYQGDLELIMWPVALLYWVWPHAIDLLIVQDAALAGAGLVAYRWTLEHLQIHAPNRRFATLVSVCVLVILVVQPWTYWAASFDYHSEPLATVFILLAGRDLWSDRRRGWIWVACVLLCGNVAASYVAALGVAALISGRGRWRIGLVLIALGVAWLGFVGVVHSGIGAALGAYAYLAKRGSATDNIGGIFTIVGGILIHPNITGHVVKERFGDIYKFIAGAGTVGFFSAVGAALTLVVLAPSALNSSPVFISDLGGAQNLMAVMACAVGVSMLATWLTRQGRALDVRRRVVLAGLALVLALGAAAQSVAESVHWTPLAARTFEKVDPASAAQLASVSADIPSQAETIVSQGVVGRFAMRHNFYPYFDSFADGQTVPVFGPTVYVVLVPNQGLELASAAGTNAAISLMHKLRAREFSDRNGVYAFAWRVPRGQHKIVFPPG
jgi:hypothetical protein